jgi:hypothetical protein
MRRSISTSLPIRSSDSSKVKSSAWRTAYTIVRASCQWSNVPPSSGNGSSTARHGSERIKSKYSVESRTRERFRAPHRSHLTSPKISTHSWGWGSIATGVVYCDYGSDEENSYSEEATARFIVRACNAHYELLAALDQAESELERMQAATGHRATDSVIVGIRRAIAKAKAPA